MMVNISQLPLSAQRTRQALARVASRPAGATGDGARDRRTSSFRCRNNCPSQRRFFYGIRTSREQRRLSMPALHELTAYEMAQGVRQRECSPVALVDALLQQIDRLEPNIEAWVTLDRAGALATAKRLEEEAQHGHVQGPLHGVPIGIKDIYYTAGIKTTCGSRIFSDHVPSYDATA